MATRPAWTIKNGKVMREDFDFAWSGGFAITQKQKNINALHVAIREAKGEKALEVSSKSTVSLGKELSAFSLQLSGVYLENIFQAAKKYENGGPYMDLLDISPKDAKRDERHKNSGRLLAFVREGETWPLEPKTAFYDFIYVNAVVEKYAYDLELSEHQWFTDIEFNPKKSINCQARALAIYKLLKQEDYFDVLNNMETWISFHKEKIRG